MSQKNQIAVVIPQTELELINNLLSQLKTALDPYVHPLTSDDIKGLAKMGDKSVAFVNKIKDYTTSNPEYTPAFMNVNDFVIDIDALNALTPILKTIQQMRDNLNDTVILSGNEAYIAALMYYGNVKFNASQGQAGAKTIYEDLQKRFAGRGKKDISK